jgi:formate hydrogenlyase subunit 3/multisubunit Na+/H+ antiporter MnhD subunit
MTLLLALTPLLPLVVTLCLFLPRWREFFLSLAPWTPLPALVLALFGQGAILELPWLLLGTELHLDSVAQVFLLFTALLWWLAGIYARGYFADPGERRRFFLFYLTAMSGNLGLILAQDLFSFLSFYALMSFASYGLVIHRGDKEVRQAGLVYLILVLVGEMLLFSGLLLYNGEYGDGPALLLLLFLGFGIKAGALPLHVWLPLAHPAAPTPASAVLSGAMIKAGLLGWIRFLPLGEVALPEWGTGIMVLGLTAALVAASIGLTQRNPKVLLAYSSISQMGLMTVIVGLGLAAPASWPAALPVIGFYALHHGLAKGALFLGVGVAERIRDGWSRFGLLLGMTMAALVMAGLPLTSGALAKAGLKGLLTTWQLDVVGGMVSWIAVSSVATTALMLRLLWIVSRVETNHTGTNVWLWISSLLLLLCSLLAVQIGNVWLNISGPVVMTWSFWWPLLAGAVVGIMYISAAAHVAIRPLPAGDILIFYRLLLRVTQQFWHKLVVRIEIVFRQIMLFLPHLFENLRAVVSPLLQMEDAISHWSFASLLMSIVLMVVALLMLL